MNHPAPPVSAPTLAEALLARGFTYRPASPGSAAQDIVRVSDGVVVTTLKANEAWEFVRAFDRQAAKASKPKKHRHDFADGDVPVVDAFACKRGRRGHDFGGRDSCVRCGAPRASRPREMHGMGGVGPARSDEYGIWASMIQRCTNPRTAHYARYGGRGITVCAEWLASFETFFADVGPRPSPGHTIDRIDNDRGYGPGNVRWATALEQRHNRSDLRLVTVGTEALCIREWSRRSGIPYETLVARANRGATGTDFLREPRGSRTRAKRIATCDALRGGS